MEGVETQRESRSYISRLPNSIHNFVSSALHLFSTAHMDSRIAVHILLMAKINIGSSILSLSDTLSLIKKILAIKRINGSIINDRDVDGSGDTHMA